MAIQGGTTYSARKEFLYGTHQPGDDYRIALYTSQAMLGPNTSHYTATGEVSGAGYTAGGKSLLGYQCGIQNHVAFLDWDNPTWPGATIKARGALIYNATKEGRALVVIDFGAEVASTNGPFVVDLPPPGATAILRID